MAPSQSCSVCSDTGKLDTHHVHRNDAGEVTMESWGAHLCQCRRELPPRDGDVKWWTTEVIHREDWQSATGFASATFEVETEVPVDDTNHRLRRTAENFYYPTMARVTFDRPDIGCLLDHDIDALSEALARCKEKMAECDNEVLPC